MIAMLQSAGPSVPWAVFILVCAACLTVIGSMWKIVEYLLKKDRESINEKLSELKGDLADIKAKQEQYSGHQSEMTGRVGRLENERTIYLTKLEFQRALGRVHRRQDTTDIILYQHARLIPGAPAPSMRRDGSDDLDPNGTEPKP